MGGQGRRERVGCGESAGWPQEDTGWTCSLANTAAPAAGREPCGSMTPHPGEETARFLPLTLP